MAALIDQDVSDKEFQNNQQGVITPRQKHLILRQFLGECALFVVCGMVFSFLLSTPEWLWGVGALVVLLAALGRTFYVYGPELLQSPTPQLAVGEIYTAQNRQSYQVAIGGVALHASKAMWKELEHGAKYAMYFSPRSKWLLSYRRIEQQQDTPS